jgi:hypothetical protein
MDLQEFKNSQIKDKLEINDEKFGKIFVSIDFSNGILMISVIGMIIS